MPYARDLFSRLGEVTAVPGRPTPVAQLADVDAFMVRSIAKVNESLLTGRPIKFVDTATTGTDHADEAWLKQAGIDSSATPGCNAIAVVEYVFSSLSTLTGRDGFSLHEHTVGIVGAGSIGRRLQTRLGVLGIKTLLCGPPHASRGDKGDLHSLDELVQHADILISHMSPSKDGPHKMLHLASEELIHSLKPGAILINAYRGTAVNNAALLSCLNEDQELSVVLDIWEDEPEPDMELLKRVDVGTPHIVGYIPGGKVCGIMQVFEAYSKFIEYEQHVALDTLLSAPEFSRTTLHSPLDQSTLKRLVHLVYDMCRDDTLLRKATGILGEFDKLRKNYLEYCEWSSLYVICDDASTTSLLCRLGFNAVYRPAR